MDKLIERLRKEEGRRAVRLGNSPVTRYAHREDVRALLREAADALEAAQMGLRYAVRVWVLSDDIEWSETKIDETVESIIDAALAKARGEG